ncbi:MAG: hypothetical protein JO340_03985 [Acidobacteriaceae bacterium]|nr:hypothetical protein [Acidobacteriaceae bacterium]
MSETLRIDPRPSSWDCKLMQLARFIATWSKDPTPVGCVIAGASNEIRSTGYNGFPRGIDDSLDERLRRPAKYFWTEHAERNAIYNAARIGTPLEGCRMYLPWFPCVDCARAIVQCGIAELVAFEPDWEHATWGEHFRIAKDLFTEQARLSVRLVDPEFVFPDSRASVAVNDALE